MPPMRTSDAVVVIPGIMGSELVDERDEVVWGLRPRLLFRQLAHGDVLARLQLPPGAPDDGIRATRLLRTPAYLPLLGGVDPYRDLLDAARQVCLSDHAVTTFPYDWRRSIAHNARLLTGLATAHLARWTSQFRALPAEERISLGEPKLTLVCHSMGGLIGRYFTEVLGGRDITRQLVTIGTPFGGSIKAVRLLANGDVLPLGLLADATRTLARTLPGVYDLLPRYPCLTSASGPTPLTVTDLHALGADLELAAAAEASAQALRDAAASAGDNACPVRPVVGVSQPTLAGLDLDAGEARFSEALAGAEPGGDGTVLRQAAWLAGTTASYLPQRHGSLARSAEATAHIAAVLTEQVLGPFQGNDGLGVALPDFVRPSQLFTVTVTPADARAVCRLIDDETGRQVDRAAALRAGEVLEAKLVAPQPGLYRVSMSGGSFSPVEDIVAAVTG